MLTLVAPPGSGALTAARLEEARTLLPVGTGEPRALAPGEAADLPLPPGARAKDIRAAIEPWRAANGFDAFIQPEDGRRKRLLVADMDSTLIGQECIDELADFAGLRAEVAAVTERAMRGEVAFEPALRERVALLKGLPETVVGTVLAERITPTPGARTLVATMRAFGATCALVSGGFTLFTGPVAARLGFDEHHGNRLLVEDGRLTGEVAEPILGRDAKLATLRTLRDRLGLPPALTLAVGDGANDLGMLGEAGFGVAYRAKPAVAAVAHGRVDHGDLTALLYAQGFAAVDFVN